VGSAEIFAFLLERGGDLSLRSPYGSSPLGLAVLYSNAEVERAILATGWSEPGSLGVVTYPPDGISAAQSRLGVTAGAVIANVLARSTADRLDLRIDDAIVEFNGGPIAKFEDLVAAVQKTRLGEEALVVFIREGTRREAKGPLGPRIGESFYKFKVYPLRDEKKEGNHG
jgi:S1-C subfamily serine protease